MQNQYLLAERAAKMRYLIVKALHGAGSGHPGGSLSCADIVTYLYFDKMNVSPETAKDANRDRFVMSKGHACPALYAALAMRGFFEEEHLWSLRTVDGLLQGHPDMHRVTGVDMSTGSLGQGISAACGIALAGKVDKKDYRVYAILGDGELQEGQVWEAAMFASHYKLDKLTAFVDYNGLQIDGDVHKVMNPTPIDEKFAAFGWHVQVIDGHSFEEIDRAVTAAEQVTDKPSVIVCRTVKGKGVSSVEQTASNHSMNVSQDVFDSWLAELQGKLAAMNA